MYNIFKRSKVEAILDISGAFLYTDMEDNVHRLQEGTI